MSLSKQIQHLDRQLLGHVCIRQQPSGTIPKFQRNLSNRDINATYSSSRLRSALAEDSRRSVSSSNGGAISRSKDPTKNLNGASSKTTRSNTITESTSRSARKAVEIPKKNPHELPPAVLDYLTKVEFFLGSDGGPPRFFCPTDAKPASKGLPRLFFLPGIEGTGYGLLLQHKQLSSIFEVTCLHVPLEDRTDFPALVRLVEEEVQREHGLNPDRTLYLLGESFGCVLAMAVAARNPTLPITLLLANPATAFPRSPLLPLLPLLHALPPNLYRAVPFLLSFTMGNPIKMAQTGLPAGANPLALAMHLRESLLNMLPSLPTVADILPQPTLEWKIRLLEEGCAATEPLLPTIPHPTLILASGQDNMLPSKEEAQRLKKKVLASAPKVLVRNFDDSGHTLLLEGGLNLASIIKGSGLYKKSAKRARPSAIEDFVFPTEEEIETGNTTGMVGAIRFFCSPVFLSTCENTGAVQLGLDALPLSRRPLLFIGNHQTYAPDLGVIIGEILGKKGVLLRGLAHPAALGMIATDASSESPVGDLFRVFGAVPVTPANMHKLLSRGEAVLLFPGGVREALRLRGEEYKLFWPDRAEFIRMAAKFGATIIPYAAVGVDDGYNFVLDADDIEQIPYLRERAQEFIDMVPRVRDESAGPAAERFIAPIVLPKQVNRLYFKFQRPIHTEGRKQELLENKEAINELYATVKSEVESGLEYLLEKREEDPYKDTALRILYEASWAGTRQAPTFTP